MRGDGWRALTGNGISKGITLSVGPTGFTRPNSPRLFGSLGFNSVGSTLLNLLPVAL